MPTPNWKESPGGSDDLAKVIEQAMEPIEEAFGSVLEGDEIASESRP